MKKTFKALLLSLLCVFVSCKSTDNDAKKFISDDTIKQTIEEVKKLAPKCDVKLLERGVNQAAALWKMEDGTQEDFKTLIVKNYAKTPEEKEYLFSRICYIMERLYGTSNQLTVELQKPLHLAGPDPIEIDYLMGSYTPFSHLSDDLFENKFAFITIANFPNYTLEDKNSLGKNWTRLEWGYARLGDVFTNRVPAELTAEKNIASGKGENYIAEYNIMMGHLLNEKGEKLFPEDMVLLSHWNLRDEIKSNYANIPNAHEKQEIIYKVMERIVDQTIPLEVINNATYDWDPYTNKTYKDGKEVALEAEGTRRYQLILDAYKVEKKIDPYTPSLPTGIQRNFEGGMEMSVEQLKELFIHLVSSEQVKQVGELIKSRLGRELRPYDIWYDGFKSRSTLSEDMLTAKTQAMYPNAEAFEKDMPRMLEALGFSKEDATYLAERIVVEGARGSGHAWGAQGKWEPARLRTRIVGNGMDYKGYNIAVHEFGHNVEQVLDLYKIDYYTLNGVPNTGFTEALAFIFQKRDLDLLGFKSERNDNTTLDIFWGLYEIMGVALVDMAVWEWLYANPEATAEDLKNATLKIAKETWNKYYYPVLGTKDSPLLAIYSHMVNSPMYLPNYPLGHIIEYQLESHFAKLNSKQEFANEIKRIYTIGRLTPQLWMQQAVGANISTQPILDEISKIMSK
ncbi:MAG: hypothetical protein U0L22_03095 [Bacteroidales bacterium]|nr:hypothetical protein [Bacteroidales bacterium]